MMMNAARKDNGVNDLVHIDSSTDSSEDDFCMDIVDKEHVPVPKVGGVSPPVPAKVAGEGNCKFPIPITEEECLFFVYFSHR